jgi:uncharacterized protein (TIGR02722 family)
MEESKMRKIIPPLACVFALMMAVSCASTPKVERVSADTQIDVSGRWNDTDVRQVCETLINDALTSPRIDAFIKDYTAKHNGEHPTVIVGRFKNSSSEHIDTSIISRMMRTAIINSGKLEFVEGGDLREDLRAERKDQLSNASEETAAAIGNEQGADFMLQGTVNSTVDQAGKTTVRAYFVSASLTNLETNRILWEGSNNDIKKVIQTPKVKL